MGKKVAANQQVRADTKATHKGHRVKHPYLRRKANVWYVRRVVPPDLRYRLGKREHSESLKTEDSQEALRLLPAVVARIDAEWERARRAPRPPDSPEVQKLYNEWFGFGRQFVDGLKAEVIRVRSLEALYEYWLKHAQPKPRSAQEGKAVIVALAESMGKRKARDVPTTEVTKRHIVTLRDQLATHKLRRSTIRKKLNLIAAMFSAALADDHLGLTTNPAKGIEVRAGAASVKRVGWTPARLTDALLVLYTRGLEDYLLFALLLTTGARLSEIAGLRRADFRLEPVPHLNLEEYDDRGLKTDNSRRLVPLHPAVGEAVLVWIATRGERPWPRTAAAYSKRLNRLTKTARGAAVIHSLRHDARTRARVLHLPEEAVDRCLGHAHANVGRGYGEFPIEALAEVWARMSWPGISFPHENA